MDYLFGLHLAIGILWLAVGFIQIYKAKKNGWSRTDETNRKAHRIFGKFAVFTVLLHTCITTTMTLENPVNQHRIIKFAYAAIVFQSISNIWQGVKYAILTRNRREDDDHLLYKKKHEMYMFYVYTRSTLGAATIRVTAWALWLVGQFLS